LCMDHTHKRSPEATARKRRVSGGVNPVASGGAPFQYQLCEERRAERLSLAASRLRDLRMNPGRETPLPAQKSVFWVAAILSALVVVYPALVAFLGFDSHVVKVMTGAVIPFPILAAFSWALYRDNLRRYPLATLKLHYQTVPCAQAYERQPRPYAVYDTLLESDRNSTPRLLPASVVHYRFDTPAGFSDYWAAVLNRLLPAKGIDSYLTASVANHKTTELADDLALVEFDLRLTRGRFLAFFPAMVLIALLYSGSRYFLSAGPDVSIAEMLIPAEIFLILFTLTLVLIRKTQRRVSHRLHKLVVRVNGQWRMFNGEWQGPEEVDLSWLGATGSLPAAPSPTPEPKTRPCNYGW